MKIKRFVAIDMRTALIQVKEELGADAVILSNKKTPEGIEIVAAMDYDAKVLMNKPVTKKSSTATSFKTKTIKNAVSMPEDQSNEAEIDSLSALLERQQQRQSEKLLNPSKKEELLPSWAQGLTDKKTEQQTNKLINNKHKTPLKLTAGKTKRNHVTSNIKTGDISVMREEIASLRSLLIHQVSNLMQEEKHRQDPIRLMLESRLIQGGFSSVIAKKLAKLSQKYTPYELAKILPKTLANTIADRSDDIVNKGGVVALIGPTGVGKTTSIAKLSARFINQYSADELVLLSTDHYRICAFEQLSTYGKIMGCQVKKVAENADIEKELYQYKHKKLVLIDTPGMGQRDKRLHQQLDNLTTNSRIPIQNYLVLAATAQQQVIEDAIVHFNRGYLAGAIITKLDETMSIAGILSVLIQNNLRVSYTTNGQRVPEDLQIADPLGLAHLALDGINNTDASLLTNTEWAGELKHAVE